MIRIALLVVAFALTPGLRAHAQVRDFADQEERERPLRRLIERAKGLRNPQPEIAAITSALQNPLLQRAAAEGLGELGPGAASAVPALIELLSKPGTDYSTQYAATMSLGQIADRSALALLLRVLSDKSRHRKVRQNASFGLQRIGVDPETVATLLRVARDTGDDPYVRGAAVSALGAVRPKRRELVLPALLWAARHEDNEIHRSGIQALSDFSPEDALPILAEDLDRGDSSAVYRMAEVGEEAIPFLAAARLSNHSEVREQTPHAIDYLGRRLGQRGKALWWVVPRMFWIELLALTLVLVAWYAWYGFRSGLPLRVRSPIRRTLHVLYVAFPPSALAGGCVLYATTQPWAAHFLPDPFLTALPFPVTATCSSVFLCLLAALWACQRKPMTEGDSM